jgi:hypothetical protein
MQTRVEIEEKTLIIRLPLQKPVRSKSSGKTLVIASIHGAIRTDVSYHGRRIVVVANAFIYPKKKQTVYRAEQGADGIPTRSITAFRQRT